MRVLANKRFDPFPIFPSYGSRLLTVVFTVRTNRIRVISARPMSRNERKVYEKEN
jgi:uncharacterized DUF497 family protein